MAAFSVASSVYTDAELLTAISANLKASGRQNEVVISYAVLGLLRNNGDLTGKEFADQFLPALPKPTHKDYNAVRNERNLGGKRFTSAQRIYRTHDEHMARQLNRQNDRSLEADVAWIENYLWKSVNPSARYSSEGQMLAKTASAPKAPRQEDAVIESIVNAFVKAIGKHALNDARVEMLNNAILSAQMRALEAGRQEAGEEADVQDEAERLAA